MLLKRESTCRFCRPCFDVIVELRFSRSRPCGRQLRTRNPKEILTMRFMVIVKASKESEAGVLPDEKILTEMGKFNEELVKAGVMLAAEGLHASAKGVRVRFGGGKSTVTDGPFTETKELIAGFWLWQVKSIEEAVEWIRRSPFQKGNEEIGNPRAFDRAAFVRH